jgi:hypothetical protein
MRGDPTSGPSMSVDDDRGAMDDAMAVATADARRELVAVVVIPLVAVMLLGTGDAIFPDVGPVGGWTCCTARVSVRCWPSRTDADTPRVHVTENGLLGWSSLRGMVRTTRSTSIGSTATDALAMVCDVTGLCGRGGTDEGRLRRGEEGR